MTLLLRTKRTSALIHDRTLYPYTPAGPRTCGLRAGTGGITPASAPPRESEPKGDLRVGRVAFRPARFLCPRVRRRPW